MISSPIERTEPRRAGTATVELAISLPMILTLAALGADLSRAASSAIVVANVARSGAEYGSMNRFAERDRAEWEARVRAIALEECESESAVDPAKLQVVVSTRTDSHGLLVCEVKVNYEFRTVMRLPFIPTSVLIERTARMRQIR